MAVLQSEVRDLLEGESFAALATLLPENRPHVTLVWVDHEDGFVLVNTGRERRKVTNLANSRTIGMAVLLPEEPYRYASVVGRVEELTEDGAIEHYNELGEQYLGKEGLYEQRHRAENQVRVKWRIRPDKVMTWGMDD